MENKLEQLLNNLIEVGWKVFGVEPNGRKVILTKRLDGRIHISYFNETIGRTGGSDFSLREITSKESGLWQFVCENRLIEPDHMKEYNGYEYRIIESALKDEEDLEKFLLENIKIS